MRTKKSEIKKYMLDGITSRQHLAEGKINELENKAIEAVQNKSPIEKNNLKQ